MNRKHESVITKKKCLWEKPALAFQMWDVAEQNQPIHRGRE